MHCKYRTEMLVCAAALCATQLWYLAESTALHICMQLLRCELWADQRMQTHSQ